MYGLGALVAVFLVSVPFTAAHVALAVRLQVTRVFWVLDFVATVYGAWWLTSSPWLIRIVGGSRLRVAAVAVLAAVSISRGYYLLDDQAAGRQLVRVNLRATPWTDALAWLRTQPKTWQVLADPGHAWKYGISVRVGAERDTVLESVKDSALAMYDRDVAMRVADRSAALMYFQSMTARDLRGLGAAYDINAVIVEQTRAVDLPVLYRNSGFVIYALR
jgi:hypothetical protein